jgi:hypothetical protein
MALSETVAAIRCGHTSVDPDETLKKALAEEPLFPLLLHAEDAGVFVQFNGTADDATIRPGMRVISINGHAVADLLPRFEAVMSSDGDIRANALAHLPKLFPIFYRVSVEQTDRFVVEAKDDAGRTVKATLPGIKHLDPATNENPVNADAKAAAARWNWASGNLGLRFPKDPQVAEIRARYFVGDDFPKWMEETFKTLRDKGTKALIIDLRGNGGGQDEYGALLVSYLTDKRFRYFDHINIKTISPSFKAESDWDKNNEGHLRDGTTPRPEGGYAVTPQLHHGLAEQSPAATPFLGKVYVLIDGGTFSTAADFCAVTHHLKRATFIGEETGGGYYGNNSGAGARITLPHSRLQVRLPMYEYWNAVPGYDGTRRGTIPDHRVEARVSDLVHGTDAAFDLAVKLAEEDGPAAP